MSYGVLGAEALRYEQRGSSHGVLGQFALSVSPRTADTSDPAEPCEGYKVQ